MLSRISSTLISSFSRLERNPSNTSKFALFRRICFIAQSKRISLFVLMVFTPDNLPLPNKPSHTTPFIMHNADIHLCANKKKPHLKGKRPLSILGEGGLGGKGKTSSFLLKSSRHLCMMLSVFYLRNPSADCWRLHIISLQFFRIRKTAVPQ